MPQTHNYQNYLSLRSTLTLPLKIKMYYSLLEDTYLKNGSPTLSKNQVKKYKYMLTAFKRFSQEEQEKFLYETLKLVKNGLGKDMNQSKDSKEKEKEKEKDESYNSSQSDGMENIKQIECTCKVKQSFLGFTKWQKKCFKLNTKAYKLKLTQHKKQTLISLPYYFVRKSSKNPKTIVLFSSSEQVHPSKSEIYISFDDSILFEEIYAHIFVCIVEINAKEILRLTKEKEEIEKQEEGMNGQVMMMMANDQISKASTILNSKLLNEYFEIKEKIMRKLESYGYKFEKIDYLEQGIIPDPDTKISVCRDRNKDRVKIEKNYKLSLEKLTQKLSILNRVRTDKLIQFEILQTFSTNISVVYFKYYFNNEIYQFLTILQQNTRKDQKTLIFKGIDNFINKQFVDFLCFKIKETENQGCLLKLVGIIKKEQKNKNQAVAFLLSLIEPYDRKEGKERKDGKVEEFWTVREMDNIQMDDMDQYYGSGLENQEVLRRSRNFSTEEAKTTHKSLFNKTYILEPTQKSTNLYMTEHPLFKQWKIHKNGGVLCINQEQINEQKKVFKYVLQQIGTNIVKGKNILNISFPVTIFKKESHLKSVARNFCFAPIFLEKVVKGTAQERVKAAVLFQISTAVMVISMTKPFNPILGQTYQGFIDGCPIFLQQVSHHPPICRYLFHGRGYKIYGTIEPKVAIGLNCVKGWSPRLNFIEFSDGIVLELTMNKMVINGMLFGDRTFNFQGLNYVYERKSRIAAEICYGCESNSVFKKKQLTYDSVSGAIYHLPHLQQPQKFTQQTLKKSPKQKLHTFLGTWNSQLSIDDKPVYNFLRDLPHELIDYENPIPSDSCYRSDLNVFMKGDLEAAQKEKEFVEEIQRRDKKLRESYSNGNGKKKQ